MANIKSQIKRIKTNEKARLRNKSVKSSLKTAVRKFREAADAGDTAAATTLMRDASRALDKAASKGVIHANQAANRKSAMAKRVAQLSSTSTANLRRLASRRCGSSSARRARWRSPGSRSGPAGRDGSPCGRTRAAHAGGPHSQGGRSHCAGSRGPRTRGLRTVTAAGALC